MKGLALLIALFAAVFVAALMIAPQHRAPRGCAETHANPTFSDMRKGECR